MDEIKKHQEHHELDSDSDSIDPELIELIKKEAAMRADSSDAEMITLRIGGKWQQLTKKELEQARKVMKALEPLEREVLRLKFGLPEEYFEECD